MLRFIILGVYAAAAVHAPAQTIEVAPELWDRPRTGSALLAQDSVKGAVRAALAKPEARIVIHHSAGQEPLVQAEELRSWLGALAIDTRRIALRSDLEPGAALKIEILP